VATILLDPKYFSDFLNSIGNLCYDFNDFAKIIAAPDYIISLFEFLGKNENILDFKIISIESFLVPKYGGFKIHVCYSFSYNNLEGFVTLEF
jgi:hypothetical protein